MKKRRAGTRPDARLAKVKGAEPARTNDLNKHAQIMAWRGSSCGSLCTHNRNCGDRVRHAFKGSDRKFCDAIARLRDERLARAAAAKGKFQFSHLDHAKDLYINPAVFGTPVCFQFACHAHGHSDYCISRIRRAVKEGSR